MANTIQPTAFHHWLMQVTKGDAAQIASYLHHEIVENQNPQAFALLEATGDEEFSGETLIKAGKLVTEICS